MEEWKEYRLGDVCSRLRSGKSIPSAEITSKGMFSVIGGNGFRGYTNMSNFKGDCVVIGRQGANCGNVHYYSGEYYMTEHAIVVVGNRLSDTYFLGCVMSLMQLGNLSSQSAQPGLSVKTLSEQIVRLPSVDYQKKISTILKSLDEKIRINRKINSNLEEQAKALFKSWFIDFEPFKGGKFVDSELGKIPEGWKVVTIGEVTDNIKEKVGDRDSIKVLSPVTSGHLVLSEEYFSKQVFSSSIAKYIVVKHNDFAYNPARINIGSIGMNEFEFDGCVSPVYVVFRCQSGYEYFFDLYRRTSYFIEEVKKRAIGGVRQTLSYKDLSLIQLIYPPKKVVDAFNFIYISFIHGIHSNDVSNKKLEAIRDTLLPKLMSGEIDVR